MAGYTIGDLVKISVSSSKDIGIIICFGGLGTFGPRWNVLWDDGKIRKMHEVDLEVISENETR